MGKLVGTVLSIVLAILVMRFVTGPSMTYWDEVERGGGCGNGTLLGVWEPVAEFNRWVCERTMSEEHR